MSNVITLRTRLVAGGALLLVALTGCGGTTTEQDPHHGITRLDLGDALGSTPEQTPDPVGAGTGVSALLDAAAQAPVATATTSATKASLRSTAGHVASLEPLTPGGDPAPVLVDEPAPVPAAPACLPGEEWDPTIPACVAQQLPEESMGGARCPDPAHVVVAVLEDGSLVCGAADDTVAGA